MKRAACLLLLVLFCGCNEPKHSFNIQLGAAQGDGLTDHAILLWPKGDISGRSYCLIIGDYEWNLSKKEQAKLYEALYPIVKRKPKSK